MVLRCADTRFESGPVTADMTTTVVNSYKWLRNDVKPLSLTLQFRIGVNYDMAVYCFNSSNICVRQSENVSVSDMWPSSVVK